MKYGFIILAAFILTACTGAAASQLEQSQEAGHQIDQVADGAVASLPSAQLEDLGLAPELTSQVWLNVDQPLRLADLRGQVVLLDMWTFG